MKAHLKILKILDEYRQNGLKRDHLKTENLPYKPLYFSPRSKHSVAYISINILSDRAEFCQY